MSCVLTNGWPLDCRSIGGIQAVYIGQWQAPGPNSMVISVTASGEITGFSGATVSFFEFAQDSEVGSLVAAPQVSIENGTYYEEITLEFSIFNFTQEMQNALNSLGQSRWRVIVLTNDNHYFLLGYTNPVNISGGNYGFGKAYGDLNGAMITMTSKEQFGLKQVTSTAVQQVVQYN
jgi:hypothetical protein